MSSLLEGGKYLISVNKASYFTVKAISDLVTPRCKSSLGSKYATARRSPMLLGSEQKEVCQI